MDPNQVLNDIEKIISKFNPLGKPDVEELCRLVYLINDLNIWIINRGRLPDKWEK